MEIAKVEAPLPPQPHQALRDPRGEGPTPSQPRVACPSPTSPSRTTGAHHHPELQGQADAHTHTLTHLHPTCPSQTHPPQPCMLPVHLRHTEPSPVPGAQPWSHAIALCADAGAHARTPDTCTHTRHVHAHAHHTSPEAQGHARPSPYHSAHPHRNLTPTACGVYRGDHPHQDTRVHSRMTDLPKPRGPSDLT